MLTLEAIVFDLDGTLGDTLPMCYAGFRAALLQFQGRNYTDREIRGLFGPSEEGVFQRLVPERWEECMRVFLAAYERAHAERPAGFPGLEVALKALAARGTKLGIVTGKGPHSAEISLRYLGLACYFDGMLAGSAQGASKPACIRRLLEGWGVDPARAAYVGDVGYDVRAAREAGVLPLGAAWAPSADAAALEAEGAAAVFRTVAGFVQWIEENIPAESGH